MYLYKSLQGVLLALETESRKMELRINKKKQVNENVL
jgi:hypothetical protein